MLYFDPLALYSCIKHNSGLLFHLVLLRIPNPQPNPRILSESVRVRIRESFVAVSDMW